MGSQAVSDDVFVSLSNQVSLDQYHTEEEIYQMSLQREPRSTKLAVSGVKSGSATFVTAVDSCRANRDYGETPDRSLFVCFVRLGLALLSILFLDVANALRTVRLLLSRLLCRQPSNYETRSINLATMNA